MYFIQIENNSLIGWLDLKNQFTLNPALAKRYRKKISAENMLHQIPFANAQVKEISTLEFITLLEESGFVFQTNSKKEFTIELQASSTALLLGEIQNIKKHRNIIFISDIYNLSNKIYKVRIKYNSDIMSE